VHWYPYPFLDAGKHGYLSIAVISVALMVVGIVLTLFIARYSQLGTATKPKKRR
jgi:VIT1/CCC1 family predicted Fe2+/Mn2+ transporter